MPSYLNLAKIHPVTDFVRNYRAYLTRMQETREPEVLTVNGVAECVLVDAETFQAMRAAWERERFINAVNQGIESMKSGAGKPVSQAFSEIRTELGL